MSVSYEILGAYVVFSFFVSHSARFFSDLEMLGMAHWFAQIFHFGANIFGMIFLFAWGYYVSWVDFAVLFIASLPGKLITGILLDGKFDELTMMIRYGVHLFGYFIAVPATLAYAIPKLYETPLLQ